MGEHAKARATAEIPPVIDFEEYVRTRHDALLRSARRLVPDPVDAQDLVQTALARTFPRWQSISDKGLADAYLRRVMINTRTEWWRARKLEEVVTCELPDTGIDDGTEQHADRAMLHDAMAAVLAPKQRQVVLLRHYRQLSTEETAQALGMSVGTVKSTLHRALARLRVELERGAYGYGRSNQDRRDRRDRREAACAAANTAAGARADTAADTRAEVLAGAPVKTPVTTAALTSNARIAAYVPKAASHTVIPSHRAVASHTAVAPFAA
jgi:RNA polymerase sigma-70 factor (sigma-E family)